MQRREFLKSAAGLGLGGVAGSASAAEPLPPEYVIKRARILTMDPALGDLAVGDIHVAQGRIVAVAPELRARAKAVEGRGFIAMPGLVNCMEHMWTAVVRGAVNDTPVATYGAARTRFGPLMTPADHYAATLYDALAFLDGGVTTINNQNHNLPTSAHTDAGLKALVDSGIRGVFSYGFYDGKPVTEPTHWTDVERVQRTLAGGLGGGRISLAFYPRVLGFSAPNGPTPEELLVAEIQRARQMGLPLSLEVATAKDLALLDRIGALGPHVHTLPLPSEPFAEADYKLLAARGVSVQLQPLQSLNGGGSRVPPDASGRPRFKDALVVESGVNFGFSTDSVTGVSDTNLFLAARVLTVLMHAAMGDGYAYRHKRSIEAATMGGAQALGLQAIAGSLTPGKQADILLIRTDTLSMATTPDLNAYRLLSSVQARDVDTVIVDGRVRKQGGRLVGVDVARVQRDLAASLAGLRARANWPPTPL